MAKPAVLSTEKVQLKQLKHYDRNARVGDIEVIRESLRTHGQYRPMIANKRTNQVLAGNHLLKALRAEGATEGLVAWVEVDDETARRIVLVDNRASDVGGYDNGLLVELLQQLEGDFAGTGWDQQNISELFDEMQKTEEGGMIVVPYQAGGGKASKGGVLSIGPKLKVRLSEREVLALAEAYDNFVEREQTDRGFVAHLVNARA